jgi:hypothetical protein
VVGVLAGAGRHQRQPSPGGRDSPLPPGGAGGGGNGSAPWGSGCGGTWTRTGPRDREAIAPTSPPTCRLGVSRPWPDPAPQRHPAEVTLARARTDLGGGSTADPLRLRDHGRRGHAVAADVVDLYGAVVNSSRRRPSRRRPDRRPGRRPPEGPGHLPDSGRHGPGHLSAGRRRGGLRPGPGPRFDPARSPRTVGGRESSLADGTARGTAQVITLPGRYRDPAHRPRGLRRDTDRGSSPGHRTGDRAARLTGDRRRAPCRGRPVSGPCRAGSPGVGRWLEAPVAGVLPGGEPPTRDRVCRGGRHRSTKDTTEPELLGSRARHPDEERR